MDEVVTNPNVSLQSEYFQHNKLILHRNPKSFLFKLDFCWIQILPFNVHWFNICSDYQK